MIDEKKLLEKFNNTEISVTLDLPVEKILGENVDLDDFAELVQEAVMAYKKMVINTIESMPKVGEWIPTAERPPEDLAPVNITLDATTRAVPRRRCEMMWNADISFEGFDKKIREWYDQFENHEGREWMLGDPPIDAQFALNLIFKALVDDKEHYSYLTTMPETTEQVNCIKLDLILKRYSRTYRKHRKQQKRKKK